MKYLLLTLGLISSFTFLSSADAARPCKTIVEACLSAGVIQAGASRQDMFNKCVRPIVSGRSLSGVQVNSSIINACRAKIQAQQ